MGIWGPPAANDLGCGELHPAEAGTVIGKSVTRALTDPEEAGPHFHTVHTPISLGFRWSDKNGDRRSEVTQSVSAGQRPNLGADDGVRLTVLVHTEALIFSRSSCSVHSVVPSSVCPSSLMRHRSHGIDSPSSFAR